MEHFYRDHRIEFLVIRDGNAWTVGIFIYYSKGPQNILVTFTVPDTFETYDEAVEAGFAAAQKLIDEGKLAI